jgi:hypothetical protein
VFGGYEHDVVSAFAGYGDGREVKRLGVNLAIDREGEDLTELRGIYIGEGKSGFREILSGAGKIVAISSNTNLSVNS